MQRRKPDDAGTGVRSNNPTRARFESALDSRVAPPLRPRRRGTVWGDIFWLFLSAGTAFLWFADTRPRAYSRPVEAPEQAAAGLAAPALPPAPDRVEPAPPPELASTAQAPGARRALHKRAKRRGKVLATRAKLKHRQHAAKQRPRG